MFFLKKIFQQKPKSYLLDNKYKIVPAFQWKGETYYMHEDPANTITGRGLTALVFMEEMLMRCNVEYLKDYIDAKKKIYSNPKQINISELIKLDNHLEERINLLIALPEHVYKLASVVFFTKEESPYRYDFEKGREKIQQWKQSPDMYAFFLQTPLKTLIPYLELPQQDSKSYLSIVEKINEMHINTLHTILYNKT